MIKSRFFWFLSAILFIGVLIILNYSDNNVKILPSFHTSSMQNLLLTHREDNKIKWELSADNAQFPAEKKEVFLSSLGLKINHSPEIYLTSDKGVYEVDKKDITLNDSVKMNIKDAVFSTDSLKWVGKDELIITGDDVKLSSKNFLIEGTGLAATIKQKEVRILNNVKAVFYR